MKLDCLVVVRGGGDIGTGVAHRLYRSGYRVIVLETAAPTAVRRAAAFAQAVFDGETNVEGIAARRFDVASMMRPLKCRPAGVVVDCSPNPAARLDWIPAIVDADGGVIDLLSPDVIVDARMAKRNLGTSLDDAPLTIGLGPGFEAGIDVDLVIETKRGHDLGRVIDRGAALPNTGEPGLVEGIGALRVLRAPGDGAFKARRSIGDVVATGDVVGEVDGEPVAAGTSGLVRGLVADGVCLLRGAKVGDIDPRGETVDPHTISDKSRAVGGAVLEGMLARGYLPGERSET